MPVRVKPRKRTGQAAGAILLAVLLLSAVFTLSARPSIAHAYGNAQEQVSTGVLDSLAPMPDTSPSPTSYMDGEPEEPVEGEAMPVDATDTSARPARH